jgi:uncharacterized protein
MELIFAALLLGLGNALHCATMCGPLMFIIFSNQNANSKKIIVPFLLYGMGKAIAYAILGLVISILGFTIKIAFSQQIMSLVLGISLILFVVIPKLKNKFNAIGLNSSIIQNKITKALHQNTLNYSMVGFLNGLLPCGAVYIALIAALAFEGNFAPMWFMLLFGIATLPILLVTLLFKNLKLVLLKNKAKQFGQIAILLVGILLVVRGANFGIKQLSPEIKKDGKMECCTNPN